MPTIIDALVVTLGLDPSNYKKGQKEVDEGLGRLKENAGSTAKEMEARGKQAAAFVSSIKSELIGLFAVVTAGKGLTSFISDSISGTAALGRFAANLNMSARELDGWGKAAESFGGTADGVRASLQNIAGSIQEYAATGNTAVLPFFRSMDIALADGQGRAKKYTDIILEVADKFKGMTAQQALYYGRNIGIQDTGLINMMREGGASTRDLVNRFTKASGITEESVRNSQQIQKQLALVRQQFEGVGQSIYESLGPALDLLSQDLLKFSTWVSEHREDIQAFFVGLVKGVEKLVQTFKDLDKATDGNSTKIIAATAAIWAMSSAIGALSAGMRGVIGLGASFGSALAVGAAGYGGWEIGSYISKNYVQNDPELSDAIGEKVAQVLAFFGNKEAQQALDINKNGVTPTVSTGSSGTTGGSQTRGIRNNNPGNLNFVGQAGASLERPGGRFAKFQTMEEGLGALVKQLRRYAARGIKSIRDIVNTYAPASDGNDTGAYMRALSKALGIGIDDQVDLSNNAQVAALVRGITAHENKGYQLTDDQVNAGVRLGSGARASSTVNNQASTSTSETNIGKIEVVTQATDAKGIARDIGGALGGSLAYQPATGDS
ncbi:hypothetical protein PF66_06195 [Pseudomonas asplenii]|uniref:Uncharacterized protein n=1 Tax=Pseudomonas asplenii TaxID=53407 RepID=A0A0M9GBY8_9PSED|nr:hypothetical protein [Pseudomonas fuscovaginae]KPA87285.1 hypothetical protein PF66_06195 [Pseudomonas fuscovaginae]